MSGTGKWSLGVAEAITICNHALLQQRHLLVGITRVRNEEAILRDTLDYVGEFVDAIVAYDDASTDSTREILQSHPKVALVVENSTWEHSVQERLMAETRHRGLLLEIVRSQLQCEWIYCFDADERITGDIRDFVARVAPADCGGVRVSLFDAYMTPDDQAPFVSGNVLVNFRRFFGPERRDILMLWRNSPSVRYQGLDAREPTGVDRVVTHFRCQHYGKAISVEQWEATCDYYAAHFPAESYGQKWSRRKGQAIHIQSDFSQPLFEWGPALFSSATSMPDTLTQAGSSTSEGIPDRLSVLLATNHFQGWTGSETLLLTLAEGLREAGCKIVIYARYLDGDWARRYVDRGILLTNRLDSIRHFSFDLAQVQHASCLLDVRAAFPELPILFWSLGVLPFLEQPVPFDVGVARYLAISEEVEANLVAHGVPADKIGVVRNLACSRRFSPREPIRQRPERILVLSYRMDDARKAMLRAAARAIEASIRFVGGPSDSLSQEELAGAINDADVVVSLGRGAVEAMLCARVPLVFDIHGGDGLVTPDNLPLLSTCNFSGRCFRRDYSISDLVAEFAQYRQEYGAQLRELAEQRYGLAGELPGLLDLYGRVSRDKVQLPIESLRLVDFCATLARQDLLQYLAQNRQSHVHAMEVQRVMRSISWRITAPLRVILNVTRRIWHRRI